MHCDLGRRQGKDQPTVPGVDGRKSEHIPEEGTVGVGVLAVHDDMRSKDHPPYSLLLR
jgi:hypothetical protein